MLLYANFLFSAATIKELGIGGGVNGGSDILGRQ